MINFINCALDLSTNKLERYTGEKIYRINMKFKAWRETHNKNDVESFYEDPLFGIVYVKNLYQSRVFSFYAVLKNILWNDTIKSVMARTSDIVSIGCGPGPEIAAYVDIVRGDCNNKSHLNIVGLDAENHWKDFILASRNCDKNMSLTFQNVFVDSYFIAKSSFSGVCIMSYPEAVNFDTHFWTMLKRKFELVIITDQSKRDLHSKLTKLEFRVHSLEYKGTKYYALYVKPPMTRISINECHLWPEYTHDCGYASMRSINNVTASKRQNCNEFSNRNGDYLDGHPSHNRAPDNTPRHGRRKHSHSNNTINQRSHKNINY